MIRVLSDAFRSEWLKRKRSFAYSVILGGSLFTPAVIVAVRLLHRSALPALYARDSFWPQLWRDSWESVAIFLLPLTAIVATTLIVQIEFKSNAWKQVRTLPIPAAAVFTAKLLVIMVMLAQFLALFSGAVYVAGVAPVIAVKHVTYPKGSFFALPLWRENALYYMECLPVVAAQYAIALRTSNALVPIAIGFMGWVGAIAAVSSPFARWWPYAYTILHYMKQTPKGAHVVAASPWMASALFAVIFAISCTMFVTHAEKG